MEENQLRIGESTHSDVVSPSSSDNEEDEETEKKLEEEVKEMVKKVEEYRSTLPNQLKSSLSSILSSQRPDFSLLDNAFSGPQSGAGSSLPNSSTELEVDDGEKTPDEVQLLRDKISSNISAIPKVLKRMNECISKIDKLVSSNETIHPAFKRKKS
ncbi:uncharacterized protein LOC104887580 [Beta vulgaris subsp. vulgaris]|uniref:uncharacterized protein LOC104887580 n=1 Tax=Beta vulgaris subsp. vulgaris TaxID=3555 RepID=UPI0020370F2E|nr:uncharacterized protein LOC104887580 [Beta vulgaris subsp. vulgaris]